MKNRLLLIVFSIPMLLHAQWLPFVNINASLENLGYSHATWGDYDKDGDLDFVLNGEPGSTIPETRIYRNDSGNFTNINALLPGLSYSTTEWGDYDNDGDLDILVTGSDHQGVPHTYIIKNSNGTFSESGITMPGISNGQATFGDYDNDGDLDILSAGNMAAMILRNESNGLFININANLMTVQSAFCNWIDYNNDGWLDAFISGDLGPSSSAKLYKNDHGVFTEDTITFMGLNAGSSRWADLENDGDKDLVLAGIDDNLEGHYLIYKNEGFDHFTKVDNYSFNIAFPSIDIADYDNDGLLDIVMVSKIQGCGGTAVTMLYHNEGNLVFSDVSTLIQGFKRGSVAWGDYNNDGYNDLLFTGLNPYDDPVTEIYRNNLGDSTYTINTPPSPPTELSSNSSGSDVTLSWHLSSDAQTLSKGLTYNLYIGTTPGSTDIVSPSSSVNSGFRKVQQLGNTGKDTSFTIHNLDPGNYYFSVQSVDNGFMGSNFSPEQIFTVYPVGIINSSDELSVYPNPVKDCIRFSNKVSEIEIFNLLGNLIIKEQLENDLLDISILQPGSYIVKGVVRGKNFTRLIVKE